MTVPLTDAQLQVLQAAIIADPALAAQPQTSDGYFEIARQLNRTASPLFWVYRSDVPTEDIYACIAWQALTPSDPATDALLWTNRALACQGKQANLRLLLSGVRSLNATRPNIRAALQDALTGLPSGANGALQSAGWAVVRDNALARPATVAERLFALTSTAQDGSTPAKAATATHDGLLSVSDIDQARHT